MTGSFFRDFMSTAARSVSLLVSNVESRFLRVGRIPDMIILN